MAASAQGFIPQLKMDVMFDGIRYSDALGAAMSHALPNYYPYRFKKGEHDPTGTGKTQIPYLMTTKDGTLMRIKGNGDSDWQIEGDLDQGYYLANDQQKRRVAIDIEPLPDWMKTNTSDGFPMSQAGVSLHGDMAIINVAPGCEFFLHKVDGVPMRCTFCSYGAPDERTEPLGQIAGRVEIPDVTLRRMQETLRAAMDDREIRHIYLVGGSLTDSALEAKRFLQLARAIKDANSDDIPVALGSGALRARDIERFQNEHLVRNVCFNLEVWSPELFAKVCPGKNNYVGYEGWIAALEHAVSLWGRGHVYSAMVAGVELEPEHDMNWEQAADLALDGAEDLCSRGIIPIYSLYWPTGGRNHPDYLSRLRSYFEKLNDGYSEIRRKHDLVVSEDFMCHRCAYMQLECDVDRCDYDSPGIAPDIDRKSHNGHAANA